jgi:hypothetical protein
MVALDSTAEVKEAMVAAACVLPSLLLRRALRLLLSLAVAAACCYCLLLLGGGDGDGGGLERRCPPERHCLATGVYGGRLVYPDVFFGAI